MKPEHDSFHSQSIADQAADWLIRIRENPDEPGLRADFERWVLSSPEHRREWESACRLWRVMGEAPKHYRRSPQPAMKRPRAGVGRRVAGVVAAGLMAACLVLVAGPSILIRLEADYRTSTGETRTVRLEDGSSVVLGPASALAADFSSGKRHVRLLAGDAYFEVTHDAARPFRVEAGGVDVTVLGTAFDVSLTDRNTQVGLEHGSVKVTGEIAGATIDRVLVPGEMVSIDRDAGAVTDEQVGAQEIGSWRDGRLIVVGATIGSVVQQIQRYHSAWISVPDPAFAAKRVTGVYDLKDPDKALGALVDSYGGRVRKVSDLARIVTSF